jgi:tetratricopeptide (TPR) repeat protein
MVRLTWRGNSIKIRAVRTQNPDALREYETGMRQKTEGQVDAALTSFRRAAIADPQFVEAQTQIGLICKDKGRHDRMYLPYAFDAFRAAARLDPANQQAHDNYILAAQESRRLTDLHTEYETLSKKDPQNEVFQRCFKNIMTLEMAMIPQSVNVGDAHASSGMRRFILFISIGMVVVGLACFVLPVLFRKGAVQGQQMSGLMKAGIGFILAGFAGFFAFTRMK